jgi:glycosyltransferase involved in cell wall biosynthesis
VPQEAEIIRTNIFEPYRTLRALLAKKKDRTHAGFISEKKGPGKMKRILGWTRGNLFIPDARATWIKPSVRFLTKYLQDNPVDIIVSTGPPHSMHLIARKMHAKTSIPWIADFRDPWVNMDHSDMFQMGERALRRHRKLEKSVLNEADHVVSVSFTETENYSLLTDKTVSTITNGFDEDDFPAASSLNEDKFILGHFGTLGADRYTPALWKALEELTKENKEFANDLEVHFAGPTDVLNLSGAKDTLGTDKVHFEAYLPHREAINKMAESAVLLLVLNNNNSEKGRIPGKIFEYMASCRPVLGIGRQISDSGKLLGENNAGQMFDRDDKDGIKEFLLSRYTSWKMGQGKLDLADSVNHYSRKALTEKMVEIFNKYSQKA